MKSITIKGSESVGKVATKALRNAGRFLACWRRSTVHFQQKKAFKAWFTLQTQSQL
jgi:hypothetical protein